MSDNTHPPDITIITDAVNRWLGYLLKCSRATLNNADATIMMERVVLNQSLEVYSPSTGQITLGEQSKFKVAMFNSRRSQLSIIDKNGNTLTANLVPRYERCHTDIIHDNNEDFENEQDSDAKSIVPCPEVDSSLDAIHCTRDHKPMKMDYILRALFDIDDTQCVTKEVITGAHASKHGVCYVYNNVKHKHKHRIDELALPSDTHPGQEEEEESDTFTVVYYPETQTLEVFPHARDEKGLYSEQQHVWHHEWRHTGTASKSNSKRYNITYHSRAHCRSQYVN